MAIILLGLNHKTAPIELREKVSLSKPQISKISGTLGSLPGIHGCAVLSTCNRTEFYFHTDEEQIAVDSVKKIMAETSGLDVSAIEPHLYLQRDEDAVRHLFSVAAGLDSMILGETQIQGQVQDAYQLSLDLGISDNIINTLFMSALTVGKRVRTETEIDRQAVSISYAAVQLSEKILHGLKGKQVLILGAGETSELTARHLLSRGIDSIFVANRTYEHAQWLANELNGKVAHLENLPNYLKIADIVISSTASPKYMLTKDDIAQAVGTDRKEPLLLIDIAVPRDIDPAVKELPNVQLFDIDDLQDVVDENLQHRQAEAVEAEYIVQEELENYMFWLDTLWVVPTIKNMRAQIEHIKATEIERAKNRIEHLTPREEKIIEQLATSIVNQWLHRPITNMKELAGRRIDQIDCYIKAVEDIFGLPREGRGDEHQKNKNRNT